MDPCSYQGGYYHGHYFPPPGSAEAVFNGSAGGSIRGPKLRVRPSRNSAAAPPPSRRAENRQDSKYVSSSRNQESRSAGQSKPGSAPSSKKSKCPPQSTHQRGIYIEELRSAMPYDSEYESDRGYTSRLANSACPRPHSRQKRHEKPAQDYQRDRPLPQTSATSRTASQPPVKARSKPNEYDSSRRTSIYDNELPPPRPSTRPTTSKAPKLPHRSDPSTTKTCGSGKGYGGSKRSKAFLDTDDFIEVYEDPRPRRRQRDAGSKSTKRPLETSDHSDDTGATSRAHDTQPSVGQQPPLEDSPTYEQDGFQYVHPADVRLSNVPNTTSLEAAMEQTRNNYVEGVSLSPSELNSTVLPLWDAMTKKSGGGR